MTWLGLFGALAIGVSAPQEAPQTPPPVASARDPQTPTQLEDVIIDGTLDEAVEQFVDGLAAPPRRRGIARWDLQLCLGVVNVRPAVGRALIDRISDVAREYDVELGAPGCEPNAVILWTADAPGLATSLVTQRRRAFRIGFSRSNRGQIALDEFQTSDAPVRWWHISFPVDAESGAILVRIGDYRPPPDSSGGFLSSKRAMTSDRLARAIIIVDIDQVQGVPFDQLGDYLAMIVLSQVDPESDLSQFETVLNTFGDPPATDGLTAWDRSYLRTLYTSGPYRRHLRRQAGHMADALKALDALESTPDGG